MSSFDNLVDDIFLGQILKSASPAIADQLLAQGGSLPPHLLRETDAAISRYGFSHAAHPAAQPAVAVRAPCLAQQREDARRSGENLDRMSKALDVTMAALPVLARVETREERIARVRATATDVMAKAMVGFDAGTISAQEVCYLETVTGNLVQAHVDARS